MPIPNIFYYTEVTMKSYRLSFLRHGRTSANADGIYIGKTDLPLSDSGRAELEEKYDLHEYPKVQRVYSSPLLRALQSAEILFPDREIVICDEMREMDFGAFEGLSVKDLMELQSYQKWIKGGLDNPAPGGESLRDMILRCNSGLNLMILDMMKQNITHAGVVTHSGIIMNILSCFGVPKMKPMEFACDYGEGFDILTNAMLWQNGNTFEIVGRIPEYSAVDEGLYTGDAEDGRGDFYGDFASDGCDDGDYDDDCDCCDDDCGCHHHENE